MIGEQGDHFEISSLLGFEIFNKVKHKMYSGNSRRIAEEDGP